MSQCSRCGSSKNVESHHIIMKSRGGSDDDTNRKNLCKECHDFVHAELNIIEYLDYVWKNPDYYRQKLNKMDKDSRYYESVRRSIKYYEDRIKLSEYRLKVLRELNSINNIIKHGYRSYWIDSKTHGQAINNHSRSKRGSYGRK